jgi:hypothetical protein
MLSTMIGNIYYFWPNWHATLGPNAFCLIAIAAFLIAAATARDWLRWTGTLLAESTVLVFISIYLSSPM